MDILIRKAAAADYDAVKRLMDEVQRLHEAWRPDIYRTGGDFFPRSYFEEKTAAGELYAAEWDGKVIGVMELSVRHIESPCHVTRNVLFIDSMAVAESQRGKGVGHRFFEEAKRLKAERKLDGIELQVNARNRVAYEMYRACGFTEKSINMELL